MTEPITISFIGTTEMKKWLEQWARDDDRSVSSIMRQILMQEIQRRERGHSTKQKSTNQLSPTS